MKTPWPYYIDHALIAIIIQLFTTMALGLDAGTTAGIMFYVGREVTQLENNDFEYVYRHAGKSWYNAFDWLGLIFPLISCLSLAYLLKHF